MGFTTNGKPVSTNLWFYKPVGESYNTTTRTALLLTLDAWVIAEILPITSDDMSYTQVQLYDMESLSGEVLTQAGAGTGALGVDSEPNSTAVVISYYTNRRGRHYRGRGYWTGLTQNDVTNGTLTVDAQTAWQSAIDQMVVDTDAIDWSHVVASRLNCNSTEAETETTDVTEWVVKRKLGNQRKRTVSI